jgi:hypothetical protein
MFSYLGFVWVSVAKQGSKTGTKTIEKDSDRIAGPSGKTYKVLNKRLAHCNFPINIIYCHNFCLPSGQSIPITS